MTPETAGMTAPRLAKLYNFLEIEVRTGRMTKDQAFSLVLTAEYIRDDPDGAFAEILVDLIAAVQKDDVASAIRLACAYRRKA